MKYICILLLCVNCAHHRYHKRPKTIMVSEAMLEASDPMYRLDSLTEGFPGPHYVCTKYARCARQGELCSMSYSKWIDPSPGQIAFMLCSPGHSCVRYGYRETMGRGDQRNPQNTEWGFCMHQSKIPKEDP